MKQEIVECDTMEEAEEALKAGKSAGLGIFEIELKKEGGREYARIVGAEGEWGEWSEVVPFDTAAIQ